MSSDESLTDEQPAETPISESDADDGHTESETGADTVEETLSETERLTGRVAMLEAENQRLRDEYARIKQTRYRQTAVALVGVGLLAVVGGLLAPATRTVLFALGGTGIFLGILTYYLAPERFIPASVGREVYAALASNEQRVVADLGLSEDRIYVPMEGEGRVRLYVPQQTAESLPDADALAETFVTADSHRGIALGPTGVPLFAEFERALSGETATTPADLTAQLSDALVEQFELVESAEHSLDPETTADAGQLTVGIVDSIYGPPAQFDHPVASFLGVGVARGLDTPVAVSVESIADGRADAVVTCRWPASTASERGFKHGDDRKT